MTVERMIKLDSWLRGHKLLVAYILLFCFCLASLLAIVERVYVYTHFSELESRLDKAEAMNQSLLRKLTR